MATHVNSTTMPGVAAALMAEATARAEGKMKSIRVLADVLAEQMAAVHGGSIRIKINHEDGFIVIRRLRDKPMTRPERGEVA